MDRSVLLAHREWPNAQTGEPVFYQCSTGNDIWSRDRVRSKHRLSKEKANVATSSIRMMESKPAVPLDLHLR